VDKMVSRAAAVASLAVGLLAATATMSAADTPTSASGDGVLSGNAVVVDLDIPITVCNPLAALLGVGEGGCVSLGVVSPDATRSSASGDGVVTGNAITLDVDLPITVSGTPPTSNPCCVPPTTVCCVPPPTCCVPPTTCCAPPTTVVRDVPSTTTTAPPSSSTTTTAPPGETTTTVAAARPVAAKALPVTGAAAGPLVATGAGVLAAGFALVSLSNRFRNRNRAL
jgi:hypothetical protein